MAAKKTTKKEAAKKEAVKEEVKKPEVEMVTVMRFNKVFNKREKMTVARDEILHGYYGDIVVEE
tara:strand:- start:23307 stop:23498 length:192 start_codon:yes stop_codon:yes gene_type:complete